MCMHYDPMHMHMRMHMHMFNMLHVHVDVHVHVHKEYRVYIVHLVLEPEGPPP